MLNTRNIQSESEAEEYKGESGMYPKKIQNITFFYNLEEVLRRYVNRVPNSSNISCERIRNDKSTQKRRRRN